MNLVTECAYADINHNASENRYFTEYISPKDLLYEDVNTSEIWYTPLHMNKLISFKQENLKLSFSLS